MSFCIIVKTSIWFLTHSIVSCLYLVSESLEIDINTTFIDSGIIDRIGINIGSKPLRVEARSIKVLIHMYMANRSCRKLSLREIIKMLLMLIRIKNSLKPLTTFIRKSSSSGLKLSDSIRIRMKMSLIMFLVNLSLNLI